MELVDLSGPAALLEWSSPLSSLLIRVALDTLGCLNQGHVRIGACLASCKGISRNLKLREELFQNQLTLIQCTNSLYLLTLSCRITLDPHRRSIAWLDAWGRILIIALENIILFGAA